MHALEHLLLCRCKGRAGDMQPFGTVYDPTWDLRAYSGWSPSLQAIVVAFRYSLATVTAPGRVQCSALPSCMYDSLCRRPSMPNHMCAL